MPTKCGKCSVELKSTELSAKCIDCNAEFHATCSQLGPQNFTKGAKKTWKCEGCVADSGSSVSQRSNKSAIGAAVDKRTFLDALTSFKTEIKNHTDSVVGCVISKLDGLKEEFQVLNGQFNALHEDHTKLQSRWDALEHANATLGKELTSLQDRLNDAEQHSRCANIEVVGVPETAGENIYAVLQKLAGALGVDFRREEVSIAHRLRLFSNKHTYAPIICQFVSRSAKEVWMAAARSKGNLKSTDISPNIQPSNVFVNEQLTPKNKALLGRARRLRREGKLHFAGYFNGKIIIKPREDDAAIRILHQEDLDTFEGWYLGIYAQFGLISFHIVKNCMQEIWSLSTYNQHYYLFFTIIIFLNPMHVQHSLIFSTIS